jgi:eukaryotic translation initiation factor 2C
VSVAEYFERSMYLPFFRAYYRPNQFSEYPNLPLRYPDMPVVDIGTKRRQILVPAELCDILPGTPYLGKLDGRETASMIKVACNPPADNAYSIRDEGLPQLGLSPREATSPLAGFGIDVSNEMTTISGRVLPPPSLSYRQGRPNVKDG